MGVPDIYGIYGYSSLSYGARVSESMTSMYTRIGTDAYISVMNNCAILSGTAFANGSSGLSKIVYNPQSKGDVIRPISVMPSAMLVLGSTIATNNVYVLTQRSIYNLITGAMSHYNTLPPTFGGNTLIAEFDRSRYIIVPFVTARNETGQTSPQGLPFSTWKSQYSGDYPYITSASYSYFYKQNLGGTALTRINNGFNLVGATLKQVSYEYGRNGESAEYRQSATVLTGVSGTLLGGVDCQFTVVNHEGNAVYVASPGINIINAHYDLVSFKPGVINEVTGNRPPFFYYTGDAVIRAATSFGVVVAESYEDAQNYHGMGTAGNVKVYIPSIDQNGYISDTVFTPGTGDNSFIDNWDTGGNPSLFLPLGSFDLTGSTSVDPGTNPPLTPIYEDVQNPDALPPGSTDMGLLSPTYNGVGMFATYFCTSYAGLLNLQQRLWGLSENVLLELIKSLGLYSDPIQAVVSLRMYPFNVQAHVPGTASAPVIMGKVTIAEASDGFLKLPANSRVEFDLGSYYIQGAFSTSHPYLDLSPYTTMNLYIPYVGNLDLNVNDFLNHTLRVKMTVDLTTGTCLAAIYADGILMMNATGQIGVDIAVTSADNSEIASRIFNAFIGMSINAGGSFITQSIGGLNNSGVGNVHKAIAGAKEGLTNVDTSSIENFNDTVVESFGDIFLGKTSMDRVGSASPANAFNLPKYCFLTVSRPTFEEPPNFDHTYGRPCHTSGQLASFTGYTKCTNVDISGISATEYEKLSIKNLLESGVYL